MAINFSLTLCEKLEIILPWGRRKRKMRRLEKKLKDTLSSDRLSDIVVFDPGRNTPIHDLADIDLDHADVYVYDSDMRYIASSGVNLQRWGLRHEDVIGTHVVNDNNLPASIKGVLSHLCESALEGLPTTLYTMWMGRTYRLVALPVYSSDGKKVIGGLNISHGSPIPLVPMYARDDAAPLEMGDVGDLPPDEHPQNNFLP